MKLKSDNISVSFVEYGSVYLWPLVLDTCIKVLIFVGGLKITVVSPQSARQYEDKFRQHYNNFSVADLGEPNRAGHCSILLNGLWGETRVTVLENTLFLR